MAEIGYESLMRPGGLEFAIKAVKVSVSEEQQQELILKLCSIVALVVEYCKQQNPPTTKQIDIYEITEKIKAEKELQAGLEENPSR